MRSAKRQPCGWLVLTPVGPSSAQAVGSQGLSLQIRRPGPTMTEWHGTSGRRAFALSPASRRAVVAASALHARLCRQARVPLPCRVQGSCRPEGYLLNPSHRRWGGCMNYCGAPDAVGRPLHWVVRCGGWYDPIVDCSLASLARITDLDEWLALLQAGSGFWKALE